MAPMPIVGVDGRFDPQAYAQHGVISSEVPQSMQLVLSENLVERIQSDPSWGAISAMIDHELWLRQPGAAA